MILVSLTMTVWANQHQTPFRNRVATNHAGFTPAIADKLLKLDS